MTIDLPADTVQLWRVNLALPSPQQQILWKVLDSSEKSQAQRFRSELQQRRFAACRGQLRLLLADYLAIAPTAIRFLKGKHGKPYVQGSEPDRGLVFNITHSGDAALFAVGYDQMLGVDLEAWREIANMEGLVKRCFSQSEQRYWLSQKESERQAIFFRFWTRKEAFVKAVGRGIALGLNRCVTALDETARFVEIPDGCGPLEEWRLFDIQTAPGFSGALAVKNPRCRISDQSYPASLITYQFYV